MSENFKEFIQEQNKPYKAIKNKDALIANLVKQKTKFLNFLLVEFTKQFPVTDKQISKWKEEKDLFDVFKK